MFLKSFMSQLATALVLTSLALPISLAKPVHAADRALVVGVDRYPFLRENGERADRDLFGAASDARRFVDFLAEGWGVKAASIKLLTDEDATREAILAAFRTWLVDGTQPGDRVLFYFAGHGFQSIDQDGDEVDDRFDEGLAPHDTKGDLGSGVLENVIKDDEIAALLQTLQGREVWVVVDACFAGTITRSAGLSNGGRTNGIRARTLTPRGPVRARSRGLFSGDAALLSHKINTRLLSMTAADTIVNDDAQGGLFAWTATTSAQLAFEHDTLGGGVFTGAFIKGLRTKAADFDGDGLVTAAELLTHVRQESEAFCSGVPMCANGSGLTPEVIAPDMHLAQVLAPPLFASVNALSPEKVLQSTHNAANSAATTMPQATADALFAHVNDFETSLKLHPGIKLELGDEIRISVSSARSGFLVLFDQGPDGTLRQIFPNRFSQAQARDGLVAAGSTLTLPDPSYGFAFEATEKGESALLALVTDARIDLGPLLGEHDDFDIVVDPVSFLVKLASRLHAPHISSDPDKRIERHLWSYQSLEYWG